MVVEIAGRTVFIGNRLGAVSEDTLLTNNTFSYCTASAVPQSEFHRDVTTYLPSTAVIKYIPQLLKSSHIHLLLLLSGSWQSLLLCKLENFQSCGRQGERSRMKLLGANWNWQWGPTSCCLIGDEKIWLFLCSQEALSQLWPRLAVSAWCLRCTKMTGRYWVYFFYVPWNIQAVSIPVWWSSE